MKSECDGELPFKVSIHRDSSSRRCDASFRRAANKNVLTAVETKLFERINTALPTETRRRYDELVKKCRSNRISKADHAELLRLTDVVEIAHAARLAAVVELAKYRGVDFDELLDELGLRTPVMAK